MTTRVTVTGIPQLRRRLSEVTKANRNILSQAQMLTVLWAREAVPVDTGKTKRSIRKGRLTASYAIVRAGGAARYIEFGTRAHEIRPRNKRALSFPYQKLATARLGSRARLRFLKSGELSSDSKKRYGNAGWFLGPKVNHPGTAPNPFLRGAAEDAVQQATADGKEIVVRYWNRGA